jgi:hypothetical protein
VYCPFVTVAVQQAVNEGACPTVSFRQSYNVIHQTSSSSAGTIFIEDPPGVSGTLTPYGLPVSRAYITAGYLSYDTAGQAQDQMLSSTLSCTLPAAELDVCQSSWAEGFTERLVMR